MKAISTNKDGAGSRVEDKASRSALRKRFRRDVQFAARVALAGIEGLVAAHGRGKK